MNNLSLPAGLNNKFVLYIVLFIALTNILGYIAVNDYHSLVLFVILGFLTSYFSRNMIVTLAAAVIGTNIIFASRHMGHRYGRYGRRGRPSEWKERTTTEWSDHWHNRQGRQGRWGPGEVGGPGGGGLRGPGGGGRGPGGRGRGPGVGVVGGPVAVMESVPLGLGRATTVAELDPLGLGTRGVAVHRTRYLWGDGRASRVPQSLKKTRKISRRDVELTMPRLWNRPTTTCRIF